MIQALESVKSLWKRAIPFALYRLPKESRAVLLVGAESTLRSYDSVSEITFEESFVIAPFNVDEKTPVVAFTPLEEYQIPLNNAETTVNNLFSEPSFSAVEASYTNLFNAYHSAIRRGEAEKLVLARQRTQKLPNSFPPVEAWKKATEAYPHAFVYLAYTEPTGLWLGASPEVLLSGEGGTWSTTALAGTQPLEEGALPTCWTEKNRAEQAYVSTYIRAVLAPLASHLEESTPYTIQAGAMAHLKTDFSFQLHSSTIVPFLLNALHPTPAVCGLPKREALEFILQHEHDKRSYYAGFLGRIYPEGATHIYVNIRCLHWQRGQVTFYAGGGIVSSSELEEEWLETERKMDTMARLIAVDPSC